METRPNEEYHELISELADQKFVGKVTLHFQFGNIEASEIYERNTKDEIKKRAAKKGQKTGKAIIAKPKQGSTTADQNQAILIKNRI